MNHRHECLIFVGCKCYDKMVDDILEEHKGLFQALAKQEEEDKMKKSIDDHLKELGKKWHHERDEIDHLVAEERARQDIKWGEQNLPDGTEDSEVNRAIEAASKVVCDTSYLAGDLTWADVLGEEVAEAFAETDPEKLKMELVQVMAVCKAWIECIHRRQK